MPNNYKTNDKEKPSIKKMQIMQWFSMPSYNFDDINETDTSVKHKKNAKSTSIHRMKDAINLEQFGPVKSGYAYIQMVLDGNLITPEFEKTLEKRIAKQVVVREAREEEIPKLVDLYNRAFLTANDPYAPMTNQNMEAILNYQNTKILIAQIWGVDAGFIIIDFEGENREIGVIAGLGTLPEWQQRGIGTTIGISSWEYFKKAGVKELKCEVYSKNLASYKLIKGMGFTAESVKYYDLKRPINSSQSS